MVANSQPPLTAHPEHSLSQRRKLASRINAIDPDRRRFHCSCIPSGRSEDYYLGLLAGLQIAWAMANHGHNDENLEKIIVLAHYIETTEFTE